MNKGKLYYVYGAGGDAVGLVEKISGRIAAENINIIDLRQDVIHGLFTVFFIADLGLSKIDDSGFARLVGAISEDTGLVLQFEKYRPSATAGGGRNMLIILTGYDKPGLISAISRDLSSYNINIEFSKMVAREGIFLMEILADISGSTIPVENLQGLVRKNMSARLIQSMFQVENVYNKDRRIILLELKSSFLGEPLISEIIRHCGLKPGYLKSLYSIGQIHKPLENAALRIENLPVRIFEEIAESVKVKPQTSELISTLKTMGYRIALSGTAFAFISDIIARRCGIDCSFGADIAINDDERTIGPLLGTEFAGQDSREKILARLRESEGVQSGDITVISGSSGDGGTLWQGLSIEFDLKTILSFYNQKILSDEAMAGLIGAFGIPEHSF